MNDSVSFSLSYLFLCDISQRARVGGQYESIKGGEFSLKLRKQNLISLSINKIRRDL